MLQLSYAIRLASYRQATEDRAVVVELPGRLIVLVTDGAGGITHGGAAADVVVWLVRERADELVDASSCVELLRHADQVVQATGGETTAVLLVVGADGSISGASAGDSEAWVVGADGTIDDLTKNQHLKRRLGSGRAVPVGFVRAGMLTGTLVAGSDGLYRYARPEAIVEVVLQEVSPGHAGEALIELVRPLSRELLDDVAVFVARLAG